MTDTTREAVERTIDDGSRVREWLLALDFQYGAEIVERQTDTLRALLARAEAAEARADAARGKALREAAGLAAFVHQDNFAPMVRTFDEAFGAACEHIERELRKRAALDQPKEKGHD